VKRILGLAILAAVAIRPAAAQVKTTAPTPPPRAAEALVDEAVAKAAASNKGVLVKFGASWCGWCHKFDKFLDDTTGVGSIMRSNFEIVGLTVLESPNLKALENPGGVELAKAMGGDVTKIGIPFFFMLDGKGKQTGSSMSMPDKSNIGMPDFAIEVTAFMDVLRTAAPRLTDAERMKIKDYLDLVAGRPKVIP
jgi:thiol-disulfide isomerase/thioredoxin